MRALVPLVAAALILAPAASRAQLEGEGQPVLVVAFTGEVAEPHAGAPERLTAVMAEVIRATGAEVTVAPRGDVLTLAGCAEPSDDCLHQALGLLQVQAVVLGEVSSTGESGAAIDLRVIAAEGEPRSRSVVVGGTSAEELDARFRPEAEAFWSGEPSPAEAALTTLPGGEPAPGEPAAGADLTATAPARSFSASAVEPYAWAVAGSGAGLLLVGGLMLMAADGKQAEVDDAPTDTVADLEALVELEESGRRYARWGSTFAVVGAVAATVGVVLVIRQGLSAGGGQPAEQGPGEVTLAPTAGPSGVGFTVTVRGWP